MNILSQKDLDKFWGKVNKINNSDKCWEWISGKTTGGYGVIRFGYYGKPQYAHRIAYELTFGKILDNLYVLHHCDNPTCCNPAHLFLGTQKDNILDRDNKKRVQHGETHYRSKLTDLQIAEIRKRYSAGKENQSILSVIFGVCQSEISRIVNYKIRK